MIWGSWISLSEKLELISKTVIMGLTGPMVFIDFFLSHSAPLCLQSLQEHHRKASTAEADTSGLMTEGSSDHFPQAGMLVLERAAKGPE